MDEDVVVVAAAVEETVAAVAAITGSALRNAASLPTTDRPTDRPPYNQAAAAFWQCRRATGHAARLAGTQPVRRHDDARRRSAGRGGGLAGAEEIPIQFLHKANASPPRGRGTPQSHHCATTGRGPVYIIYFIRYYSVFIIFFLIGMTTTRSQGLPNVKSLKHIYRRQLTKVINRTHLSTECAYMQCRKPPLLISARAVEEPTIPHATTNNSYHTHRCLTVSVIRSCPLKFKQDLIHTAPSLRVMGEKNLR